MKRRLITLALAVLLCLELSLPALADASSFLSHRFSASYSDISDGHWSADGVERAATLGICSLDESAPRSPLDMLEAIKPYGNTNEQDFIDLICNFIQGYRLSSQFQEMRAQNAAPEPDSSSPFGRLPLEQLKAFLSPEQQSRLDNITLLMQAVQQFA